MHLWTSIGESEWLALSDIQEVSAHFRRSQKFVSLMLSVMNSLAPGDYY